MGRLLASIAVVVLLAGCSGDPGPAAPVDGGDARAGAGVLRVLVVDDAIRPLSGALVAVRETALSATTDAGGEVRFTGLAAGAYVVVVERADYFAAKVAATVESGIEPKVTVVTLAADDTSIAYVEVTQEDFFVDQAFVVGADLTGSFSFSAGSVTVFLPGGVPDWVQSEATWTSTQPLGDTMRINFLICPEGGNLCEDVPGTSGPSPIHVAANASLLVDLGYALDGDLYAPLWATYESPAGGGVILQQAVRVTTHRFYGFLPPEGWLFSRDGEPTVPA